MTTLNAGEGKVEELARIAYEADPFQSGAPGKTFSWEDADWAHASMIKRVSALLTALRNPSEEMVEAMKRAADVSPFDDELLNAFTAAIDVLLAPKDPEQ